MAIGGKGRGIQIVVGAEYTDKDLKRAQRDLDKLRQKTQANVGPMGKLAGTLKRSLGPALVAAAAAAGALAVKLGVDGVKAAIEDEKTVATLANTLRQLGFAHEQVNVEGFIADLEAATGVADERLRPALGLLVAATGDLDEAQRRLSQAMDLSVFTGQDLDAIVRALTRSIATQSAGTLSRYGINIDKARIKTEGFSVALDEALAPSVGAMDAQVNTLGGQMQRLTAQVDNLLEAFGYGFIGAFDDANGQMGDTADALRDLQPTFEAFGERIGEAVVGVSKLVTGFGDLADATGIDYTTHAEELNLYTGTLSMAGDIIERIASLFSDASGATAEFNDATGDTFGGGDFVTRTGDFADSMEDVGDEIMAAADALAIFNGLLDERAAARRYEKALDDFRDSLEENGNTFRDTTAAGLENLDALDGIFEAALKVADSQETAAAKAEVMRDAMRDAQRVMENLGLSEGQRRRLLQPFVDAQVELDKTYISADEVRRALVDIPTDIQVNIDIKLRETWAARASGGTGYDWRQQQNNQPWRPAMDDTGTLDTGVRIGSSSFAPVDMMSGFGTQVPGPSRPDQPVVRTGGLVINGGINVTAAPGESAEVTVPRALRRLAWVSGLSG